LKHNKVFFIGVIFILIGILVNEWSIAAFFADDGQIATVSIRAIVWIFDISCILLGLILVVFRQSGKNILLSACSVVIALILVESIGFFFVRTPKDFVPPIIPDSVLHHKWIPNLSIKKVEDLRRNKPYWFYTNSQSWAEKNDIQFTKPKNTYRIFYLGNSNVQGVVEPKYNVVEQVEQALNEIYDPTKTEFEVINTGTTSYSTLLYFLLIKSQILKYSPDLVVINVDMSDITGDYLYQKTAVFDAEGIPIAVLPSSKEDQKKYRMAPEGIIEIPETQIFMAHLENYSFTLGVVTKAISNIQNISYNSPYRNKPVYKVKPGTNWLAHNWSAETMHNVELSIGYLSLIAELLDTNHVKFFVTGVPHYPQFSGVWSSKPHEKLAEAANEHNFLYLNSFSALHPDIENTTVDEYYWENDPTHFNEKGYALWADAQVQFMLKNKNELLP